MTEATSHGTSLADFLKAAEAEDVLTLAERRLIVSQALVLLEQNYVHLSFKVAMHGVNPVQRLRVMLSRLNRAATEGTGTEREFHAELLEIFHSLRDLHTKYLVPSPYREVTAYLPFLVEEAFARTDGELLVKYVVTALQQGYRPPEGSAFGPGVEITHWNDVPIGRAVRLNAERYAGSNAAARYARGLASLTLRPLMAHLPPDEELVTVRFIAPGGHAETLSEIWRVARNPNMPDPDVLDEDAVKVAVDVHAAVIGRVRSALFAPLSPGGADLETRKPFAEVFRARTVSTPSGDFGHIRIWTFHVAAKDGDAFVDEFVRLAGLLPQNGLIVDVRGNGGGLLPAAENLLQTMSPRHVEPEPAQFSTSALNLRLCAKHGGRQPGLIDLAAWYPSMAQAVETGSPFSIAFPISSPAKVRGRGQSYHGPIVLITDARCYSATDTFAAGFQDHGIGPILGTDALTGAGGANVWTHQLLTQLLDAPEPEDDSPYRSLPAGAAMTVAVRRMLRVGPAAGTPIEDLGVRAGERHNLTLKDVLSGNADLLDRAGAILAKLPARRLDIVSVTAAGGSLAVRLSSAGLDRIDAYADGRPRGTADVTPGEVVMTVGAAAGLLRFEGYSRGNLVAAREMKAGPAPA
jgi:C-terminal processing protease CtpA/Prc